MEQFLLELPKCEHHVHVEGTLSPTLLFSLLEKHKNKISLPDEFPKDPTSLKARYNNFVNLDDFLKFYYIGMQSLLDEDDFYQLALEYLRHAHLENVKHIELFFDPQGHTDRGISFDVFMPAFQKAIEYAKQNFGISCKLIMCLLRHLPPNSDLSTNDGSQIDGMSTIKAAHEYFNDGTILGLGLDSSEADFPPSLFQECYRFVRENYPNVRFTAHAGEEGGPEFVKDSLDLLKTTRIDHGINSHKDESLMKMLNKNQTMLTICPVSNLKLCVVSELKQLPINKFLEFGVPFSINSDDPSYFNAYLLENYFRLQEAFEFDIEIWCQIAKNSIAGSWIDDDEFKQALIDEVITIYEKYKGTL